jgi:hypothetical protein
MLYFILDELKAVYKIDAPPTHVDSAAEDFIENIIGVKFDDKIKFCPSQSLPKKYLKYTTSLVQAKPVFSGGYVFTIQTAQASLVFVKSFFNSIENKYFKDDKDYEVTLGRVYRIFRMHSNRKYMVKIGQKLRWLIKLYGDDYPIRSLL